MSANKKHKLLCIICPQGCEMEVTEKAGELSFSKGICPRGQKYAKQEIYNPCRVLTTTVEIANADFGMLPVRTADAIPKEKLEAAMRQIAKIKVSAPIQLGEVISQDIADSGIPLIASRTVDRIPT